MKKRPINDHKTHISIGLIDVSTIRSRAAQLATLSDIELQANTAKLRDQLSQNREPARFQSEIFALATEAVRRSTGKTYFDVQLQAGQVLARGDLAEMQTGEGKTLVTLLPVFHAVMHGKNVHVSTTNSYLAERDCEELRPALELLNVSVALLPEENDTDAKRSAYQCDVTYGTGYEFGFDFLRDQLTLRDQRPDRLGDAWLRSLTNTPKPKATLTQSDRSVTIVDEIDSVLIDEANTPLVISFFTDDSADPKPYHVAAEVADSLNDNIDYHVDETQSQITITQSGADRIDAKQQSRPSLKLHRPWRIYVEQALRAKHLMKRDIDYVIQDGKVALVDQHTGRIFPERKWRDGLHQAIEIREGAELTAETNSFARISRQRFFKMYQQGTGMTGTASDAVDEFKAFFSLPVVPIPLNQPSRRIVMPSRLFADETSKLRAIVDDAILRTNQGQPVLIGTRTVSQSQDVSSLLNTRKASHELLNGIQDADEAAVIQSAGRSGVITVATNMAGRGTDIKLDADARDAGGLHVIAAEPNRSRRVDRQLIGRTARQGDPGSCQLFAAADDELVDEFASPLAKRIRRNATASGEAKLDADSILLSAQQRAEAMDFKRRQRLMQHDRWIDGVLQTLVGETDGRRAG